MVDMSDYKLAWQVYLGVGLLAGLIWCMLLRRVQIGVVRYWLMIAGVVFLFLPARHPDVSELWVPSAGGAVLTIFTDGVAKAVPMLIIIVAGQILALVIGVVLAFVFPRQNNEGKRVAPSKVAASGRTEPSIGSE